MDNSSLKFWRIFAILLLILNFGLIFFLFFQTKQMHEPREHGGPANFIIEKLKLNQGQIQQFNLLKNAHHEAILKLDKEGRILRQEYFNGLKSNPCVQSDSILSLITDNQKQKEVVTFTHFNDVKKICNSTQQIEFNLIIEEVLKRLHRNQPPPNRP